MFSRLRGSRQARKNPSLDRMATQDDRDHLVEFVRSRPSVEAYVEPRTNVTQMTVVLVAATGEWTRRRIEGGGDARSLGQKLGIPVYDVHKTGYPQRMREWTAAQKKRADGGA